MWRVEFIFTDWRQIALRQLKEFEQTNQQQQFSATEILDEFDGTTVGIPHGISYEDALYGKGAVFSQSKESHIQYPFYMGLPKQGTLEFIVKIERGYWYKDYDLRYDSGRALLFTTDIQCGDVTWPGSTWLYAFDNGDIKFNIAGEKYNSVKPEYNLWARGTSFKFGEWHVIGVSYGSEGMWISVDGEIVASKPESKQPLGAGGTHSSPVDIPTIGESVPGFWQNNQWEGGFEGIVECFRASSEQKDWILYKKIPSPPIYLSIPTTDAYPMSRAIIFPRCRVTIFPTCFSYLAFSNLRYNLRPRVLNFKVFF